MNDPAGGGELSHTYECSRDYHLFGPGPKRILALDGGGVRGAISVAFLERIEEIFSDRQRAIAMERIAAAERAGAPPGKLAQERAQEQSRVARLGDWFDLIGGTSTGALISGALALGYNTDEIKKFYLERASFIFQRPFWRIPGLQAKFDARALQKEIDAVVEDRTFDSTDLITGLCVVSKRMDTGSPWIISNNPNAPYWNSKRPDPASGDKGFIGNRHYRLATLVRASTAAPHFFDPEIVRIIGEDDAGKQHAVTHDEENDSLSKLNASLGRFPRTTMLLTKLRALLLARKAGPNPETHGLFVDGGVTPFNNPSIATLMQVVLKPYGICWPLGPEALTFVSIGTGSYRPRLSFTELGFAGPVKLALHALLSMMSDSQTQALAQMQWLGDCPDPWPINSELGTLADERPPGSRWFRFMRYDVRLERDWIKDNLGQNLSDKDVERCRNMDDPGIIVEIYELAREAAKRQVKVEHFFPAAITTIG